MQLKRPAFAVFLLCALVFGTGPVLAEAPVIAFLLPCSTCADRFEGLDEPAFVAEIKALDPRASVLVYNAQGSGDLQVSQAEAALTKGADVIVVSAMTKAAATMIVNKAHADDVPVISYDNLLTDVPIDFYVSFDNARVGVLQAQFLIDNLAKGSTIIMVNGPQDVTTGRLFKTGSHAVIDPAVETGEIVIGYEVDIAAWSPTDAQTKTEQALLALGDRVRGVLVANDGMASGVITALNLNQLNGSVLVTGQDATDAALQRILVGTQSMTVYKAITREAQTAANIAYLLAKGRYFDVDYAANTSIDNGSGKVPSILLEPVTVTVDNIDKTVLTDGFTSLERICVGAAASADICRDLQP